MFQLLSLVFRLQRHLRVENIKRMSRDELVELFRNFCVPFGQRKYRDTGRGKVLNRTRHCSPEPVAKLSVINHNHNVRQPHLKRDRSKPPPEQLSSQMKRIKLDNNVNRDTIKNSKRKMSIDAVSFHYFFCV